jgi:hypothetical protein
MYASNEHKLTAGFLGKFIYNMAVSKIIPVDKKDDVFFN